ncbi:anthranilate synthase component I [Streptomyces sp. WMMC897]|uniref:anthranilate synthase component I n=1 Tax=Streptomyces sp. WMMC897 TaxID=3014782 RepID=UPI0022B6A491|nr:anthranilate synthase component I [Streptomyces sp. WMMC897]MCZ7415999.1 anthranilate synthase component I [Streptomyces sp. WMMC897]
MALQDTVNVPAAVTGRRGASTPCGVEITRSARDAGSAREARARLEDLLDRRRGMLRFLGEERIVGYVDPPVEVSLRSVEMTVRALNDRGRVLVPALHAALERERERVTRADDVLTVRTDAAWAVFAEEERTRHSGVFNALRAILRALAVPGDSLLGLYGAFGYDLIFQMDPVDWRQQRAPEDRDLVLHLPDTVWELDLTRDQATVHHYEFVFRGAETAGLPRETPAAPFVPGVPKSLRDHLPGEYAQIVANAKPLFRSGDLFEVVPSQVFRRACTSTPADVFRRLRAHNPAPHSLLMNLGEQEYLVGASPEMFVRVRREETAADERQVVESAPISGTITRGRDAMEDAARIRELLASVKDESELTMCTDVDRNDKSRVCVPGSVRVVERRRIEKYSALIHTVDRVRGVLRPDRDALDGFLAHLWAVTVTGAPKLAAVEFIERQERSPRRWYGGAVGRLGFDGTVDSVLTLRTMHITHGVATVRAGATLLHDSSPEAEEAETELKAGALLEVLDEPTRGRPSAVTVREPGPGAGLRVLMVDHRDSFAHCLADHLRQTGAHVTTFRSGNHLPVLARQRPDLVVLSPGPGHPREFGVAETMAEAERCGLAVFGVCLGLQGLVEYLGGTLAVLAEPVHGKASAVNVTAPDSRLLAGLPSRFEVGRYHSLYAPADAVPEALRVTAVTDDGVAMAVEHRTRPWSAVQFHPESIMSTGEDAGRRIIDNAVSALTSAVLRRP